MNCTHTLSTFNHDCFVIETVIVMTSTDRRHTHILSPHMFTRTLDPTALYQCQCAAGESSHLSATSHEPVKWPVWFLFVHMCSRNLCAQDIMCMYVCVYTVGSKTTVPGLSPMAMSCHLVITSHSPRQIHLWWSRASRRAWGKFKVYRETPNQTNGCNVSCLAADFSRQNGGNSCN